MQCKDSFISSEIIVIMGVQVSEYLGLAACIACIVK